MASLNELLYCMVRARVFLRSDFLLSLRNGPASILSSFSGDMEPPAAACDTLLWFPLREPRYDAMLLFKASLCCVLSKTL